MRCTCDQFRKTSYSCWVRPCTKALRLAVIYAFFGQTARTRCLVYVPAFVTFYLRALNKLWNLKTNRIFYPNRILRESDSIRDKFWVGTRRLCSWSLSNAISVVSLPLFIFIRMKRDTLYGGERRTVKRVASGCFLLLFFYVHYSSTVLSLILYPIVIGLTCRRISWVLLCTLHPNTDRLYYFFNNRFLEVRPARKHLLHTIMPHERGCFRNIFVCFFWRRTRVRAAYSLSDF